MTLFFNCIFLLKILFICMNYAYDFKFLEYIYNNGYLGDFYWLFFFLKYVIFYFPLYVWELNIRSGICKESVFCYCTPGEGNGYPLQYSCLKNSMDGGACWVQSVGSQRVGHYWLTNTLTFMLAYSEFLFSQVVNLAGPILQSLSF